MDDFLLRLYLEQAKDECERAFSAVKALNAALESNGELDPFVPAQAIIHHAAAVSKIFWPPGSRDKVARKRAHRRGETLRSELALVRPHAVQARTLRDHFEHFDERLDAWVQQSKNRYIVNQLVGPRTAIGGDAIADTDIIHHYDPAAKTYAFRGEKFDIQALAAGLDDIFLRIESRLSKPWPYNRSLGGA